MKNFLYCVYLKVSILLFISNCNKIRAQSNVTGEEFSSTGEFTLKNGRTFELPNIHRQEQPTLNFDINYNSTINHQKTTWQFKDNTKSRLFFFHDGSRLTLKIKKNLKEFTAYSVKWYPFPLVSDQSDNISEEQKNFEFCVYFRNNSDLETFWYNTYQSVKPTFPMDINVKSTKKPFGNIYSPINETDYAYILNQMFFNTDGFALNLPCSYNVFVQKTLNQLCFSVNKTFSVLYLQIFAGKNIRAVTKYAVQNQIINKFLLKSVSKKVNFTHPYGQHFSTLYWVLPTNCSLTNISNLQQNGVFFLKQTKQHGLENVNGQIELPFTDISTLNNTKFIFKNSQQVNQLLQEVNGTNFRLVMPLTLNFTQLSSELKVTTDDYYDFLMNITEEDFLIDYLKYNISYGILLSGNLKTDSFKNLVKNSEKKTDKQIIKTKNFNSFQVLKYILAYSSIFYEHLDFYFKTPNNSNDFLMEFYAHPNEYEFFEVFNPNEFVLDLNLYHIYSNKNATVPSSLISQMAFNTQDSPAFLQLTGNIDGQQSSEEMLRSIVASALTASIGGYSWLVPYRVGTVGRTPLTEELYIRWVQAVALMPKMAFHTPPWEVGPRAVEATRAAIALHQSLEDVFVELAKVRVREGHPLIRPLWYEAPDDANTYAIDDQFMLGDRFLVAPVLYVAQRSRLVYLPEGNWTEVSGSSGHRVYQGGRWRRFSAPLERLLYFKKVE